MTNLDITKPITTRDGRPVNNVCVDQRGQLWGLVDGEMRTRPPDGQVVSYTDDGKDWINPPESHDITVYVYRTAAILWVSVYDYKNSADCLISKKTITIIEGEGL